MATFSLDFLLENWGEGCGGQMDGCKKSQFPPNVALWHIVGNEICGLPLRRFLSSDQKFLWFLSITIKAFRLKDWARHILGNWTYSFEGLHYIFKHFLHPFYDRPQSFNFSIQKGSFDSPIWIRILWQKSLRHISFHPSIWIWGGIPNPLILLVISKNSNHF